MNDRIIVQKRTIKIEKGIKKETWEDYHSCWCQLLDLFGNEKNTSVDTRFESTIKFRCRYSKKLELLVLENTKDYRIMFKNKPLDLVFVDSCNGSKAETILQVKKFS